MCEARACTRINIYTAVEKIYLYTCTHLPQQPKDKHRDKEFGLVRTTRPLEEQFFAPARRLRELSNCVFL